MTFSHNTFSQLPWTHAGLIFLTHYFADFPPSLFFFVLDSFFTYWSHAGLTLLTNYFADFPPNVFFFVLDSFSTYFLTFSSTFFDPRVLGYATSVCDCMARCVDVMLGVCKSSLRVHDCMGACVDVMLCVYSWSVYDCMGVCVWKLFCVYACILL